MPGGITAPITLSFAGGREAVSPPAVTFLCCRWICHLCHQLTLGGRSDPCTLRLLQLRDRGALTPNPGRDWDTKFPPAHVSERTLLVLWDQVESESWVFCRGFQVFTQGFQLCPLYKSHCLGGGGALMLARALLIREAVHTFPTLSPGEEFRNNGET